MEAIAIISIVIITAIVTAAIVFGLLVYLGKKNIENGEMAIFHQQEKYRLQVEKDKKFLKQFQYQVFVNPDNKLFYKDQFMEGRVIRLVNYDELNPGNKDVLMDQHPVAGRIVFKVWYKNNDDDTIEA